MEVTEKIKLFEKRFPNFSKDIINAFTNYYGSTVEQFLDDPKFKDKEPHIVGFEIKFFLDDKL